MENCIPLYYKCCLIRIRTFIKMSCFTIPNLIMYEVWNAWEKVCCIRFFILSQLTHEPPKLKTTLKTPPKQATNPLQFVKVGPCSLYRTAQEQLQKVQEVKKIKQEVRDDPEDWQSVSNFKDISLLIKSLDFS